MNEIIETFEITFLEQLNISEITLNNIENEEIFWDINDKENNGFHISRYYTLKQKIISVLEAQKLIQIDLENINNPNHEKFNVKIHKWHYTSVKPGNSHTMLNTYTSNSESSVTGIGRMENIKLSNGPLLYMSKPVFIPNQLVQIYLELSNDFSNISTFPNKEEDLWKMIQQWADSMNNLRCDIFHEKIETYLITNNKFSVYEVHKIMNHIDERQMDFAHNLEVNEKEKNQNFKKALMFIKNNKL